MKKTLIHLNSSPYSSTSSKEGLDLALVFAAFEQFVDLCFSGAALSLLYNNQIPSKEHGTHLYKLLDGLVFYDIENIYIQENSAQAKDASTWQGVKALKAEAWYALFSQYDHVFRF